MSEYLDQFLADMSGRLIPQQKEVFELLDTLEEGQQARLLGWVCRQMIEPGAEFWSVLQDALYDSDFMESLIKGT